MKRSTKTTKKLTLTKETVRLISNRELEGLAGGATTNCAYPQGGGSINTCLLTCLVC